MRKHSVTVPLVLCRGVVQEHRDSAYGTPLSPWRTSFFVFIDLVPLVAKHSGVGDVITSARHLLREALDRAEKYTMNASAVLLLWGISSVASTGAHVQAFANAVLAELSERDAPPAERSSASCRFSDGDTTTPPAFTCMGTACGAVHCPASHECPAAVTGSLDDALPFSAARLRRHARASYLHRRETTRAHAAALPASCRQAIVTVSCNECASAWCMPICSCACSCACLWSCLWSCLCS